MRTNTFLAALMVILDNAKCTDAQFDVHACDDAYNKQAQADYMAAQSDNGAAYAYALIEHTERGGHTYTSNVGCEASLGDIIVWVNKDCDIVGAYVILGM